MLKTIHKQEIPITNEFILALPYGSKVIAVQHQPKRHLEKDLLRKERAYIWYMFNPRNYGEQWLNEFQLVGTGHPVNISDDNQYVGTFQLYDGEFVGHLFHLGATRKVFPE